MTGIELKALRLTAGLTQEQLGQKLGYTGNTARQYVSRIERGKVGISKPMELALLSVLNPQASDKSGTQQSG